MKFEELSLSPNILSGLKDVNYLETTELQEEVIPILLDGKDALIKSEPGKNKNGAIIIPALERIEQKEEVEGTVALILTPNSKEAKEMDELVWAMGYHAQIECASVDLDGERQEQEEALESRVPVMVANPGPLLDIMQDNKFIFRNVEYLVIDSADKMVSLGLTDKIKKISRRVLSEHQTIVFSSEINKDIKDFANSYLDEPEIIGFESVANAKELAGPPSVSQNLSQGYIYVPNRMKITTLMAHLEDSKTDNCAIFTASKRGTDRLYRVMRKKGLKVTSLHGKLSDEKRAQRFANFTNGDVQYLLVADISAAELDISRITQVINYDVPNDPDEYRYRADLVGSGKASRIVSLVSKQDRSDINDLENQLGQAPKELPLPDKVKQKLKERKKQKKTSKKQRGKNRKSRNGQKQKSKKDHDELELPKPSYDKLSGGRSGNDDEDESGMIGFFKKLFSS